MKLTQQQLEEYYNPQKVYEESVTEIKFLTGLELTLGESVALRLIAKDCCQRMRHLKELPRREYTARSEFPLKSEAVCRFLQDYYGLTIQTQQDYIDFRELRPDCNKSSGNLDWIKDWFKMKQEEAHLL